MVKNKLYLIRHAKSDWSVPGLRDFDRPLNKRGQRDAPMMARQLKKRGIQPDVILSSPAVRALTTAHIFTEILKSPPDHIQTEMKIYEGDTRDYLECINRIDPGVKEALLVGHNPDITAFAEALSGQSFHNLPTASVVGISFPTELAWADIAPGIGKQLFFIYPKLYH